MKFDVMQKQVLESPPLGDMNQDLQNLPATTNV
jgi:hypothetical protein